MINYLKKTIKHRVWSLKINDKKFIIVWDNVFLHTSKDVKYYIANTEVIICTINSFSPCWILPCEWFCYLKKVWKNKKNRQVSHIFI